jgi:hypothetical protein
MDPLVASSTVQRTVLNGAKSAVIGCGILIE